MKLLFDENLSPKLPNRLGDLFPNLLHVRDVGMKATSDPIVWDYAKDNDLMIVSKDADMHDLSLVFGNLPKVIWLHWETVQHCKLKMCCGEILTRSNCFMRIRIYRCLPYHSAAVASNLFTGFLQIEKT